MEGIQESAEAGAQTVIDSVAAEAAAFPWVAAVICFCAAGGITWALVEALKATGLSKLKRRPPTTAGEQTVLRALARRWWWWPLMILGVSLACGTAIGGVGSLVDQLAGGHLGWWGLLVGALGGALPWLAMKVLRGIGDKASDLLLGPLKRKLNGGGK